MCGRYALQTSLAEICTAFKAKTTLSGLNPLFNASPGMQLPIIIQGHLGTALWGWPVHTANIRPPINIRIETVAQKPLFAPSYARHRHCLIPANGFYEWDSHGQPFYVQDTAAPLIAFQGLWTKNTDNQVCFGILTQNASPNLAAIHPRMPMIQTPDGKSVDNMLISHPVSRLVNNMNNNNDALLERVTTVTQGNLFTS